MLPSRVFFGWWVTLAFAAMVFISTGVRFTIGPFLKPMVAGRRHRRDGRAGPDGQVVPHDQAHRTHLGSLSGFLAEIKRAADVTG
jgi:hypothetical protein